MALSTITNAGFQKSGNSFSRREFGFKFKVIGMRISEGDSGHPVYAQPNDEAKLAEMRKLTDFTGGATFPDIGVIPIRAAVPIAGTDSSPRYSMTYESLVDPDEITGTFDIQEIGLFAQDFIETADWIASNNYIAGRSYVTHNDRAWVASRNIMAVPDWVTNVVYLTGDRVRYDINGKYFEARIDNPDPLIPPVDGSSWKELSTVSDIEPSDQNQDWLNIAVDLTESNLIPFGDPYLYYIQVRDVAAKQNNEHVTRWELTISFDEALAEVFFDESSTVAFTELQLQFIEFMTSENLQIRELAEDIQVLESDVEAIKTHLGI